MALLLHIAGAIKHHVIDRDSTLRRMLPGTGALQVIPAQKHSITPVFGAVGLWVIAGFAAVSLAGDEHASEAQDVALVEVASDWVVESGSSDITVVQRGPQVQGRFW